MKKQSSYNLEWKIWTVKIRDSVQFDIDLHMSTNLLAYSSVGKSFKFSPITKMKFLKFSEFVLHDSNYWSGTGEFTAS